jgi:hypothetical protein
MTGVDTIARVPREHFIRGKTIKEIVRELHVSRNTVHKILRSGATEFEYERTVQPQPRLGPWREQLERLLSANAARPRRERLTVMRLFEELRGLGYLPFAQTGSQLPSASRRVCLGRSNRRDLQGSWLRGSSDTCRKAICPSCSTRAAGATWWTPPPWPPCEPGMLWRCQ